MLSSGQHIAIDQLRRKGHARLAATVLRMFQEDGKSLRGVHDELIAAAKIVLPVPKTGE